MPDPTADSAAPHAAAPAPPTSTPRDRRARHRAHRRTALPRVDADLLWPLAALATVVLAGTRTLRGLPLPDDGALTAPAFRLLRGEEIGVPLLSPEGVGAVHTAVYATVTRAFSRYDTLVAAGRELLLVLLVVAAVLVWRISWRLGLSNPAAAAAVLIFGAVPPLVPAHAVSTPAAIAVVWALLAGWLLISRPAAPAAWTVAVLAGLLAALLAPDVLLLLATGLAGGAAATGRVRRAWPAPVRSGAAGLLVLVAVAVRLLLPHWDPQREDPARWSTGTPGLIGVSAVLLAVGLLAAWWLPRLRGPAVALGATTLLAVAPPSGRLPALLLCLPVAAVLVGGLLEHAARSLVATRRGPARILRLVAATAVAASLVAAGVALATAPRSDFGAAARGALVAWAREQLPLDGRLSADDRTSAELLHAGLPPGAVAAAGVPVPATGTSSVVLRVVPGDPPAGSAPVARFDARDGLPALTVANPRPVPPTAGELEHRRVLGQALAANPETVADDRVIAQLARGDLDPRLLSLLAGIGAQYGIGLDSLPAVPAEDGWTLVRHAVISSVGGAPLAGDEAQTDRVLALLRAQRAPYAADVIRIVPRGLLVGYRYIPDPDAVLTRAAGG